MRHMGASGHTVAGSGTADGSAFVAGTTDVLFIALQGADYTADASRRPRRYWRGYYYRSSNWLIPTFN